MACDNASMLKICTIAINLLIAGTMLLGNALAQQTPAAKPAQSAPAGKAQTSPAPQTQTPPAAAPNPALPTQKDRISYAIGMNIGKGMQKESIDIDPSFLARGLQDTLSGSKTLLTDEEAQATLTELQNQVRQKMEAKRQQEMESNKKDGDAFLAANKSKPGVVVLPSGLQYKVLKEGTGPKPAATDSVVCNYRGTLLNGTEFDSSYKRGQPLTIPVSGVIKGWTEALQLMPVGSKWQLYIPPDLAYGPRGAGADIGPNATLIFEVDLLSIASKTPQQQQPQQQQPQQ